MVEKTGTETTENLSAAKALQDRLSFEPANAWELLAPEDEERVEAFAAEYRAFIDAGKTERECARLAAAALEEAGFKDADAIKNGERIAAGEKVYRIVRGKSVLAAIVGEAPTGVGLNILGAHIDAPRIDLKTNPLYEDDGLAFFDTHYYGGIKHYQWTAIPLAMHGIVIDGEGESHEIVVGEAEGDPVFTITDLLPHLASDQMKKKASEFIGGEGLDILVGSRPYPAAVPADKKIKDRIKLLCLQTLNERYGITGQDFAAAELEFVPAWKSRDLGLDRSMIGGYGHDDRSCAFPALKALIDIAREGKIPPKTLMIYLSDKEEIGSVGNTGAQSRNFENFIAFLLAKTDQRSIGDPEMDLRTALSRSAMLSADVNPGFDHNYEEVYDKKNASFLGKGLALTKYTGRGGKFFGSEANAEFCRRVQLILNRAKVPWQFGDLGKVDKGGGATIAQYAAHLGIEALDCGIAVLSMHSPFEVISKIDLHTAYRAYKAFLIDN